MTGREKELKLRYSTAVFRVWNGEPEMLLIHGCEDGAAYIVGAKELEAVAEQIRMLLQNNTTDEPCRRDHSTAILQNAADPKV